jgi:hypothetical protein
VGALVALDVAFDEVDLAREPEDVLPATAREVVEDPNLVAIAKQSARRRASR